MLAVPGVLSGFLVPLQAHLRVVLFIQLGRAAEDQPDLLHAVLEPIAQGEALVAEKSHLLPPSCVTSATCGTSSALCCRTVGSASLMRGSSWCSSREGPRPGAQSHRTHRRARGNDQLS